jgi:hypothetical protein
LSDQIQIYDNHGSIVQQLTSLRTRES